MLDSGNFDKNKNKNDLVAQLEFLYNELYDYANDTIIKLFVNAELSDDIVNEYCIKMNNYDIQFKNIFDTLDEEFNVVTRLINKIKEKENYYLEKLSTIENEELPEYLLVSNILDMIIDFDSYIYKINNGYVQHEHSKIIEILNKLEKI
jgi:hypothetical protein